MAAPAFAASIDASAICLGVMGRWGVLLAESPEPVTAQVIMTDRLIEFIVEATFHTLLFLEV
tara:strand:+ start:94 stop:279 length:186 start_codon:yes stop_codon:yes gene_type:complete